MTALNRQISLTPLALLAILVSGSGACLAQRIDPEIARHIAAIKAVDNHAHPVLAPPLDASDRDFDALPVSSLS